MKWVVDLELGITLLKELVVDAPTADEARDVARGWAEDCSGTIGNGDDEWDESEEVGGGGYTTYPAVKLLDRRTAQRNDAYTVASKTRCDNCDTTGIKTVPYGDARVCGPCLASLPPLTG